MLNYLMLFYFFTSGLGFYLFFECKYGPKLRRKAKLIGPVSFELAIPRDIISFFFIGVVLHIFYIANSATVTSLSIIFTFECAATFLFDKFVQSELAS